MAEAVDLTTAAELGIQVSVENAIQNVLGNTDSNMTMAAAQDIVNLENTISRKFKSLTESITDVAKGISNLRSSQDETARQSADAALAAEEQNSPLSRMADTLDDILLFLQEKFKPTGLGSEDANVGMLAPRGDEPAKLEEEKPKEDKKVDTKNDGSVFVGGTIVAATLMAIKDKLNETWVGLTQTFLKPFTALKLAIGKLPNYIKNLNTRFPKITKFITDLSSKIKQFGGKVWTNFATKFPKLAKRLESVMSVVKNFGSSITKTVKNFNLGKFFAPVTNALTKLTGGAGFGLKGLSKFMSPVLGIFKKLALPITLVLEAFEAFKMIFVGSFTKNAEALSESISEKGILGRAWYGFTHMFQTLATFGYELVETFKALAEAAFTFLDPIKAAFLNIVDTITEYVFKVYNLMADSTMGSFLGMEKMETEGMKKDNKIKALLRNSGMSQNDTTKDRVSKWMERGAKVGVDLEDVDDYRSLQLKVQAAEKAKKMQDESATLKKTNPEPYGVGRYQNQQNIQQNSIQNNTNIEVQMPSAGDMLNQ